VEPKPGEGRFLAAPTRSEENVKRILATAFVTLLALAAAMPAVAGDAKEVKLTGYITDEYCGAKNANADGVDCAKACAKKGSDLAIYSDGKLYKLSDKEMALKHLGYEVVVTGTINEDGSVKVANIEKNEKSA